MMTHWLLIIRYKSIGFRRWLKANAFTLFVLGPMILIGFYFILEPYLIILAERLHRAVVVWPVSHLYPVAFVLTILFIALALSSTIREVYSLRSADSCLDALPVPEITRLNVTLFFRLLKNLPAWGVLLIVLGNIGANGSRDPMRLITSASLTVGAFAVISLLQILAALVLVHYRLFSAGRVMAQAVGLLVVVVLAQWHPLFLLPLLPLATPTAAFSATLGWTLSLTGSASSVLDQPWLHPILITALYALTWRVYAHWRNADRERARKIMARRYGGRQWLAGRLHRWLGVAVAAQVQRDWQLTRRGFSSAVYVALSFALLFQCLFVLAVQRSELSPEWFSQLAQVCCAFSVVSLTTLPAFVLKYQLPYFWIEKATGISPEDIWKAKFWYARLAAVPVWIASSVVVIVLSPFSSLDGVLLIVRLALIAFIVASVMGVMSFGIASHPVLGLVFSGIAAMMPAALFIFYWTGWPLWVYVYVTAMRSLGDWARGRVWFTEVET